MKVNINSFIIVIITILIFFSVGNADAPGTPSSDIPTQVPVGVAPSGTPSENNNSQYHDSFPEEYVFKNHLKNFIILIITIISWIFSFYILRKTLELKDKSGNFLLISLFILSFVIIFVWSLFLVRNGIYSVDSNLIINIFDNPQYYSPPFILASILPFVIGVIESLFFLLTNTNKNVSNNRRKFIFIITYNSLTIIANIASIISLLRDL